ncbi:MAG: hypothetical protein V1862_13775, partial [Methanobacteriota archaeon]
TLIKSMPIDFIPKEELPNISVGDSITLFNGQGYFPAKVVELNATNVTFDLNHPLAGETLSFDVSLVNLTPAKEVEAMMAQYAQDETVEMPVEQVAESVKPSSETQTAPKNATSGV